MNVTVNQVLTIVGRLDDSPGFDSARERFRRFLIERVTDAHSARVVIQQCQQISGEQNHRAQQDAVVLTGKFLGFQTAFGRYQRDPGAAPVSGEWESRRRLHVTLNVCTHQTAAIELDALAKVVRDGLNSHAPTDTPRVALCVVTPLYPAKARIEEMLRARKHSDVRMISLGGILQMVDMVAAGRLTHDDVLEMLNPDVNLDSVVHLLDHSATAVPRISEHAAGDVAVPEAEPPGGSYWIVAIRLDPLTPPDQFVASVIAKRRILAINPAPHVQRSIQAGDLICACITGEGFVAQAQVAGVITDGSPVVRDSERFKQMLRLTDVTVYATPVISAPELVRRVDLSLTEGAAPGAVAIPVSRREFELVTRSTALSESH
jgi:hypothetical protein